MLSYKTYKHPIRGYQAVKIGFSWPAFFFAPFWALYRKLWGHGIALIIAIPTLDLIGRALMSRMSTDIFDTPIGTFIVLAIVLLYVIFPFLYAGFEGNRWLDTSMIRRGYKYLGTMSAYTEDGAIALAFESEANNGASVDDTDDKRREPTIGSFDID